MSPDPKPAPALGALGALELIRGEKGDKWRTTSDVTVRDVTGRALTIPAGYEHDRYTWAPNLADELPAVAHDFSYDPLGARRLWDNGKRITRRAADKLLLFLMSQSADELTREVAPLYYKGVRWLGAMSWTKGAARLWLSRAIGKPHARDALKK